ncbi:hypothetical protein MHF_0568 [Mycoplasma haemofelis Ohio2]|uniref:Uncharacterized protein n=1 Tax=Mycoplasma haemofelis (strain Ohio2) TaxID=859194 RepID=F6FHZ2_MYCHI|nr:hypothetical protein MHF_0568 [Mycoplasma haemofelis Ohio2]
MKLASPVPVLSAGVLAVAGGSLYSNYQVSQPTPYILNKDSSIGEEIREETGCIVHVSERVWNNDKSLFVFRVLKKQGRNLFLRDIPPSQGRFISDVNDACSGRKASFKAGEKSQVYVYQEGGQWMYSSHYQSKDWT